MLGGIVAIAVAVIAAVGSVSVARIKWHSDHEANEIAEQKAITDSQSAALEVLKVLVSEQGQRIDKQETKIDLLEKKVDALETERDTYKRLLAVEEAYSELLRQHIYNRLPPPPPEHP
jgi:uncharacterized protein HemX